MNFLRSEEVLLVWVFVSGILGLPVDGSLGNGRIVSPGVEPLASLASVWLIGTLLTLLVFAGLLDNGSSEPNTVLNRL